MRKEPGAMPRGTKHWKAKLTETKVRRLRQLYEEGYPMADAHRRVAPEVHYQTVVSAITGANWGHID